MAAKEVETGSRDSISSLADEVLGQLLSFLSTKLAASSSVLSKQWRNLLPLVHNLDFDESMVLYPKKKSSSSTGGHGFVNFVEKTLFLLRDSPIKKFSLKWESEIAKSHANRLIYNALRRGVLELDLRSSVRTGIENKLFMSKTLVKLTLSLGCYYPQEMIEPPGGVYFPALKSLSLNSVRFGYYHMYVWILSSPVLEEYNVCDEDPAKSGWEGWVWGSSIKRTILHRYYYQKEHLMVAIRTLNLVFLDYSSYVTQSYHVKLDSLVEARLDLKLWKYRVPPYPTLYPMLEYWGDASHHNL